MVQDGGVRRRESSAISRIRGRGQGSRGSDAGWPIVHQARRGAGGRGRGNELSFVVNASALSKAWTQRTAGVGHVGVLGHVDAACRAEQWHFDGRRYPLRDLPRSMRHCSGHLFFSSSSTQHSLCERPSRLTDSPLFFPFIAPSRGHSGGADRGRTFCPCSSQCGMFVGYFFSASQKPEPIPDPAPHSALRAVAASTERIAARYSHRHTRVDHRHEKRTDAGKQTSRRRRNALLHVWLHLCS